MCAWIVLFILEGKNCCRAETPPQNALFFCWKKMLWIFSNWNNNGKLQKAVAVPVPWTCVHGIFLSILNFVWGSQDVGAPFLYNRVALWSLVFWFCCSVDDARMTQDDPWVSVLSSQQVAKHGMPVTTSLCKSSTALPCSLQNLPGCLSSLTLVWVVKICESPLKMSI